MTTTDDPIAVYIRQLHERFDREREEIRTRSVALGYAFGRVDEAVDRGGDRPDDDQHATHFADAFEKNTDGNWVDLAQQYTAFQSGKDTPK